MVKKQLAKLIDVKSLISLIAAGTFACLAINGRLSEGQTVVLLTLVFQSLFTKGKTKESDDDSV